MKEKDEVLRELIKNENEMINHRMNWFLTLQGFMFAAISFAWEKNTELCLVFSLVGALSALSVGLLLRSGVKEVKCLEEEGRELSNPVIGRKFEETPKVIHSFLPWQFLPILMVSAWSLILIIKIIQN